jgi:hypothetical protein
MRWYDLLSPPLRKLDSMKTCNELHFPLARHADRQEITLQNVLGKIQFQGRYEFDQTIDCIAVCWSLRKEPQGEISSFV